jgi:Meiotically up-regulated gene 113
LSSTFCAFAIHPLAASHALTDSGSLILCLVRLFTPHMETTPPNPKKFSSPWYSKAGLLYFVAAGRPPVAIKIGVTQATSMKTRLKAIQSANHEPVELLGVIRFDSGEKALLQAERAERELHKRFGSSRLVDWSVGFPSV